MNATLRKITLFWAVATLALAGLLVATTFAIAAGPTKPKLSFVKTNATIQWSTDVGSSPDGGISNTNAQSLKINAFGPQGNSGASAYTYGNDEDLVAIRGLELSEITNLGFDTKGYLGAGAPRISLGTSGRTYFLAASTCNEDKGDGWVTADFIHDSTCVINDSLGVEYANWDAVVLAHGPDTVVPSPSDWFLIVDEAPSLTYIDRLTVQNWCWTGNGTNGTVNVSSGNCVDGSD